MLIPFEVKEIYQMDFNPERGILCVPLVVIAFVNFVFDFTLESQSVGK